MLGPLTNHASSRRGDEAHYKRPAWASPLPRTGSRYVGIAAHRASLGQGVGQTGFPFSFSSRSLRPGPIHKIERNRTISNFVRFRPRRINDLRRQPLKSFDFLQEPCSRRGHESHFEEPERRSPTKADPKTSTKLVHL